VPVAPPPPPLTNRASLDLLGVQVERAPDGGLTVTMKVKDLTQAQLLNDATALESGTLIWAFRFSNGYQPAAVSAHWSAAGFGFGFDDYSTAGAECLGAPSTSAPNPKVEKCLVFPGKTAVDGAVNQDKGLITLHVPKALLRGLGPETGAGGTQAETPAVAGTRFYDAAAFSFASNSPVPSVQSFMQSPDNTPAFDFTLPAPGKPTGGPIGHPVDLPGNGNGNGNGSGNGSGSGGTGGLAGTGGLGAPLGALALLLGAVAARRRRTS
jgi:hypothetical protein